MCQFFSLIATKDNIFWDNMIDNHSELIEKFNIREKTGENFNICKIEITPKNNVFDNSKDWVFRIDENVIPDWIDIIDIEKKVRNILKEMQNQYILKNKQIKILENGRYWLKNCEIEILRNSIVNEMRENSIVNEMWENSIVNEMWENSIVNEMRENSIVKQMWENSIVNEMRENSIVNEMRGNSIVNEMWGNSIVNEMRENSIVKQMWGNSIVKQMWGNSIVNEMWGNSYYKKENNIYTKNKNLKIITL